MLFGGQLGERVEPVRPVVGAFAYGPVLHSERDGVGYARIKLLPSLHRRNEAVEDVARKPLFHLPLVKDERAVNVFHLRVFSYLGHTLSSECVMLDALVSL